MHRAVQYLDSKECICSCVCCACWLHCTALRATKSSALAIKRQKQRASTYCTCTDYTVINFFEDNFLPVAVEGAIDAPFPHKSSVQLTCEQQSAL